MTLRTKGEEGEWRSFICNSSFKLEVVLGGADSGESGDRVARRVLCFLQGRVVGAQERIGGQLLGHGARHGRFALGAEIVDAPGSGGQILVAWLDRQSEMRIGLG